ncbi:MAG: hypothetical protein JJE28_03035 [Actinomycetales bacterium]|nr:hypothetical protein [Actinomycetales bacterium]
MSRRGSSGWMFVEYIPKTLLAEAQMLNLAVLRLFVVAFYKPIARPLLRWMETR